jgi:hypothetical protein
MKAFEHLIDYTLDFGFTISVWDGEEWQVKRSHDRAAIIEAVESVEEAKLRIRDLAGEIVGSALVSAFGLEDDETMMDWSDVDFLEAWEEAYNATLEG